MIRVVVGFKKSILKEPSKTLRKRGLKSLPE